VTDIGLRILLQAQDQASRIISGVGNQLLKAAGDAGPLLLGAGLITAGVIAVGVAATKMAADFQQAMLANVAHAGLAKNQVNAVSDAILNMAPIVGKSPTLLAEAMYPILSAFSGITNQGAKAAISLTTLKNSAETVAGSTTKVEAVAQAAVGTFNALGLATNNVSTNTKRMNDLFDVMDLTVQLGNMHWEQYKNVVSKLAVAIQGTGIKFNESQAALATMTNEGFSAQKASTYLINTFNTLAIKTNALSAHAKKLGIDFNASKYGPMSLADKIEYLNKITDGNKQKLLALMGNNATALKTFNALSIGIDAYRTNLDKLNHAHGALKTSFDTASQGFNFAVQRVHAFIDVLLIKIGTQLLPILTRFVNMIIPAATWLISMATAISKNQTAMEIIKNVLIVLGAVIGTVLISALIGMAVALYGAAAAALLATVSLFGLELPLLLIGLIVGAVIIAAIEIFQHWGQITKWVGGIMSWLGDHVHAIFSGMGSAIGGFFSSLGGAAHSKVTDFKNFVGNAFSSLGSSVHGALEGVKSTVTGWGNWLYNHNRYIKAIVDAWPAAMKIAGTAIRTVLTGIKNFVGGIWSAIGTFIHDRLVWIENTVGAIFSAIGTFIHDRLTWVQGVVGVIFSWIGSLMQSKTTQASNAVGNAFSSLGSKVQSILSGLWNWISGWFGKLAGQFFSWGGNLIGMLINGIKGAVGGLFSTIGGIAHNIAGMLGFHSPPKLGPLHDADVYMPNMMKMFEHGIVANMPAVHAALNRVAAPMATSLSPSSHSSTSYSTGGNVYIGSVVVNAGAGSASNPSQLADQFVREVSRKLRQSGNLITWTSGGRA